MKIVTLRTTADEHCPTDRTCPSVHDLDTDPDHRYVISKIVTGAAEFAAFSPLMVAGEVLGFMPARFIPDANPMLERTRGVRDAALRADRQYVILTAVTDTEVFARFAHLMAPGEQLGWVPLPQLTEV